MSAAVPRKKRDAAPLQGADHDGIGRVAKRGFHAQFPRLLETRHVIESAAADDGSLNCFVRYFAPWLSFSWPYPFESLLIQRSLYNFLIDGYRLRFPLSVVVAEISGGNAGIVREKREIAFRE